MIDMHCHILWGIDDASKTRAQSLDMLRLALSDGIEGIVATPHIKKGVFDNDELSIQRAFDALQEVLIQEKIPLTIYKGAENYVAHHTIHDCLAGALVCYHTTPYVLVEFAWTNNIHDHPTRYLAQLLEKGYIPVVAHPERYECVRDDMNIVREWRRMGCLMQVNRTSILAYDKITFAHEIALWMLEEDLVDVIASDAHCTYAPRLPKLSDVYSYVQERYGEERSQRCMCDNPKKILGI